MFVGRYVEYASRIRPSTIPASEPLGYDRPFVYAITLSFVIGASWATSSVLIGGDPLPSAVGYGFVAGLSALVAAVLTDLPRSE